MILLKIATCILSISVVSCVEYKPTENNETCWTESIQICKLSTSPQNATKYSIDHPIVKSSITQDCYPWMFRNETNGECECSDIPNGAVLCDHTIPRTYILDCFCMTFNKERNETELGRCLQGCARQVYNELPQNVSNLTSYSCGNIHKDFPLCGKCKPGYSPLVYSYNMSCINCTGMTYNWIKYIAVAYIPLTIFFFLVITFKFNGTSPLVRSYITVCQGFASPISIRASFSVTQKYTFSGIALKIVTTIYGIWNLDFFRTVLPPICLNITPLQALFLDYAIAFYPLLLVTVAYILISLHSRDVRIVVWLWKPFQKLFGSKKKDWKLKGSISQAFTTFFMLSYLKVLNATADLLVYTKKYTLGLGEKNFQTKAVLYYDPSVEYFKGDHLYYGIIALLVGVLFVIFPLVFLVVYPMRWFQKCLNFCHIKRQSIDIFINYYQGHFKDGTNGTRDYRYFSILYFVLEIVIFGLFTLFKSICTYPVAAIIMVLLMFTILVVQPYKEQFRAYSVIDTFMLLVLAISFIIATSADEADTKDKVMTIPLWSLYGVMQTVPFFYLIGLIIWWVFVKKNLKQKLPCFHVQTLTDLNQSDEIPDRIENPNTYEPQATPLLQASQHYQHYHRQ